MSVYGEICGYQVGSEKMIQPSYDYRCNPGENILMPYRITTTNEDGTKTEWEVPAVKEWTEQMMNEHEELKTRLVPIDLLYHGRLADLYPDLDTEQHWQMNLLMRMKSDTERFGMEQNEPLCKNEVPREGLVIRKEGDELSEAFKLKCDAFFAWEKGQMDAGVVDAEMMDGYGDGEDAGENAEIPSERPVQ
jgi:hypothetical protein